MDITYIPMARGFVYLAVVLDWFSRRVLSWRVSITMEAAFCVETLEDALARHGKREIFNTDQGSQFTGAAFTGVLASHGIAISMDGRGTWRDNVFVERLWRSVKYEEVYLRAYDTVSDTRASIGIPRLFGLQFRLTNNSEISSEYTPIQSDEARNSCASRELGATRPIEMRYFSKNPVNSRGRVKTIVRSAVIKPSPKSISVLPSIKVGTPLKIK
jgi:transposase InsO family protein